jgi:hypothetical protein
MSDQDILTDKSEAVDSQPILEHAKVISDQDILTKKLEALDSQPMLKHAKVI